MVRSLFLSSTYTSLPRSLFLSLIQSLSLALSGVAPIARGAQVRPRFALSGSVSALDKALHGLIYCAPPHYNAQIGGLARSFLPPLSHKRTNSLVCPPTPPVSLALFVVWTLPSEMGQAESRT